MPATKHHLKIEKGATLSVVFDVEDTAGTAIDLTGFAGRGTIRPSVGSSTTTQALTVTITTAASGIVTVSLTATETAALTAGFVGVYDVEVYSGTVVYRIAEGVAIVSGEVTT